MKTTKDIRQMAKRTYPYEDEEVWANDTVDAQREGYLKGVEEYIQWQKEQVLNNSLNYYANQDEVKLQPVQAFQEEQSTKQVKTYSKEEVEGLFQGYYMKHVYNPEDGSQRQTSIDLSNFLKENL